MIGENLKKSVLKDAFQGKISERLFTDSSAKETIFKIKQIKEKNIVEKKYKKTPIGKDICEFEKEYDIPDEWEWVRFIDLCSVMTCGYASTPQYVSDGMPFLSAKNVKPYKFKPEEYKCISNELYNKLTVNCKPEKNDILLTRVGAGIGESAIIDKDMDFAIYVSLTLIKLVDYSLINNKYILYWLNSPYGISTSIKNITGKESSQGNLNVDDVRNFMIPFPPVEEQKRIVDKLDEIFEKLDDVKVIEEQIDILKAKFPEDMKKAILDYAMTGKMIGKDDKRWDEENPNNIYKHLWEVTAWDKKFKEVDKSHQKIVCKYKYYLASEMEKLKKDEGDVYLLSTGTFEGWTTEDMVGDYIAEGEVVAIPWGGSPSVKYYKGKFVTTDNRIATSLDDKVLLNKYLYYFMQSKLAYLDTIYRGTSLRHPSMKAVLEMKIPVPTIEEQVVIINKIEKLLPLINEIEKLYK